MRKHLYERMSLSRAAKRLCVTTTQLKACVELLERLVVVDGIEIRFTRLDERDRIRVDETNLDGFLDEFAESGISRTQALLLIIATQREDGE